MEREQKRGTLSTGDLGHPAEMGWGDSNEEASTWGFPHRRASRVSLLLQAFLYHGLDNLEMAAFSLFLRV